MESVSSNLGFNTLGYLCLTLSPTVYMTLLATPAVPPPNTGAGPVIPVGTTIPKAYLHQYAHSAATVVFNIFQNIYRALCQKLLGAVKDNFFHFLHRPHLRYIGYSTLDLLTHLYAMYSVITNAYFLANIMLSREA